MARPTGRPSSTEGMRRFLGDGTSLATQATGAGPKDGVGRPAIAFPRSASVRCALSRPLLWRRLGRGGSAFARVVVGIALAEQTVTRRGVHVRTVSLRYSRVTVPDWGNEELVTVAEVAALLKLNQQTIRNWIDQGSLRYGLVGGYACCALISTRSLSARTTPPPRRPRTATRPAAKRSGTACTQGRSRPALLTDSSGLDSCAKGKAMTVRAERLPQAFAMFQERSQSASRRSCSERICSRVLPMRSPSQIRTSSA